MDKRQEITTAIWAFIRLYDPHPCHVHTLFDAMLTTYLQEEVTAALQYEIWDYRIFISSAGYLMCHDGKTWGSRKSTDNLYRHLEAYRQ